MPYKYSVIYKSDEMNYNMATAKDEKVVEVTDFDESCFKEAL